MYQVFQIVKQLFFALVLAFTAQIEKIRHDLSGQILEFLNLRLTILKLTPALLQLSLCFLEIGLVLLVFRVPFRLHGVNGFFQFIQLLLKLFQLLLFFLQSGIRSTQEKPDIRLRFSLCDYLKEGIIKNIVVIPLVVVRIILRSRTAQRTDLLLRQAVAVSAECPDGRKVGHTGVKCARGLILGIVLVVSAVNRFVADIIGDTVFDRDAGSVGLDHRQTFFRLGQRELLFLYLNILPLQIQLGQCTVVGKQFVTFLDLLSLLDIDLVDLLRIRKIFGLQLVG